MSAGLRKLVLNRGVDDIISGLPNHVLDKIFERLPVQDAARTSILSRKWRYLWSACPYLVFDQELFMKIYANRPYHGHNYVNLIHKILFLHDGPVLDFDVYIPNLPFFWDEHIDEWLLFLSRNGIHKLRLHYNCPTPYKLPSYVFSSPKLTNLNLFNVIFKPPVGFSVFANLVEAHFLKVTFVACAFNEFSPVAPLLNRVFFTLCSGIKNFNIYAPKAVTMSVYQSTEVTPIFFDKFPKLAGLSIVIGPAYQEGGTSMNLCELHKRFLSVTALRLDGSFLKISAAIAIEKRLSLVFHRLQALQFYSLSFSDLDQISCALGLLNNSPSMVLIAVSVLPSNGTDVESVLALLKSPNCMIKMLNLRAVKLLFMEGSKAELLFIKCILSRSPNLEFVRVKYCVDDKDQQLNISNELMRFPRASNKAAIIYER